MRALSFAAVYDMLCPDTLNIFMYSSVWKHCAIVSLYFCIGTNTDVWMGVRLLGATGYN